MMDSGVIEQLSEERWLSPFPQFQTTLRPDRAAMCLLEGRVILLCDNSPVALILPTDYNSFIQTSDDNITIGLKLPLYDGSSVIWHLFLQ